MSSKKQAGKPKQQFGGMRSNDGKLQLSYIYEFPNALEVVSQIAAKGAQKYARGNWKEGLCEHEILDSHGRHMMDVVGKDIIYNDDFGTHNLGHAIWNLMVMLEQRLAHGRLIRNKDGIIECVRSPEFKHISEDPEYTVPAPK